VNAEEFQVNDVVVYSTSSGRCLSEGIITGEARGGRLVIRLTSRTYRGAKQSLSGRSADVYVMAKNLKRKFPLAPAPPYPERTE
jgi:hypothetical protein